jgi:hypothetical protein
MAELSSPSRAGLWRRHPALMSLLVTVLALVAALAWPLLQARWFPSDAGAPRHDLPWQVQVAPDGSSEVFGLSLGHSTLADLEQRFGDVLRVGLIVPHGQAPALEAFVDGYQAGFVSGKLVLAFSSEPDWLLAARSRAPRHEVGEGGRSRRYELSPADLATARQAPLVGLVFLPSARLDEATVRQRFGEPTERVVGPGGEVQLLYPARGVAVAVPPAEGEAARAKAVIQYAAPRDFEPRLRAPLRAASAGT